MKRGQLVYLIADNDLAIEEAHYLRWIPSGAIVCRGNTEIRVANYWTTAVDAERELWHRIRKRRYALDQERRMLSHRINEFATKGVPLRRAG